MYLSSFYKLKFEKYMFNAKVFGPFAISAALWCTFLLIQSAGSSTPHFITLSTPISSHQARVSPVESQKKIFEETDEYHKHRKSAKIFTKNYHLKKIYLYLWETRTCILDLLSGSSYKNIANNHILKYSSLCFKFCVEVGYK